MIKEIHFYRKLPLLLRVYPNINMPLNDTKKYTIKKNIL
jgi:hypothetical protein